MTKLAALTTILLATSTGLAHAETKLTTTVFTGSPGGFLVDSTIVAGEHDAVLIDAQFSLADAHLLMAA